MSEELVRLNIGSGAKGLEGWRNIDRKLGQEAYPLPGDIADGSVDEIRASHVLEHFGHQEVATVLHHWASKLKPGGRLAVAVPNLKWIAENYLEGKPVNVQGYLMGGQIDEDDFHCAAFDWEALAELMTSCGLTRISEWTSDVVDCASLACSLNLQGFRPSSDDVGMKGVYGILAAPRFGPVSHFQCQAKAFSRLGLPMSITQGCFWNQILSEGIEEILTHKHAEYVLTLDFDTIFQADDVLEMYRLMQARPDVDAVCPVQSKRGSEHALFGVEKGEDGKPTRAWYKADFAKSLTRIETGHFGLTLIRASKLRELPRPWMIATPGPDGRWTNEGGKIDADIEFWYRWRQKGHTLYLANRVVVGHLEEVITWPDGLYKPVHQSVADYGTRGRPPEVLR